MNRAATGPDPNSQWGRLVAIHGSVLEVEFSGDLPPINEAVRLFGNVLSGELVIGVLVVLAGVLVPVPIMLLSVLTGVIQAYIFAILAVVYVSAAVRAPTAEQ